jgi:D-glycero-D-manno-heptose 1,7-bisphosphate phosphatase
MAIKAVFLDRDGTVNEEKEYVYQPEKFHLIPGALEALRLLNERGVKIYIITNQGGIARSFYTEEDYRALTDYMLKLFRGHGISVEDVLYCPHHPDGNIPEYTKNCSCRKPGTALIDAVIEREGFFPEELALVGDKNTDIEAGRKIGMTTCLVETGYGAAEKENTKADFIAPDVLAAVKKILSLTG